MTAEKTGCLRIGGGLFAAAGLWIVIGAALFPDRVAFANESGDKMPQWLNILMGCVFLVIGLAGLGMNRWFSQRFWAAAILIVVAIVVFGAVMGDPNDRSFPQGRWAAVVAALIFLLGGIVAAAPNAQRLGGFLVLVIITLFGVMLTGLVIRGADADRSSFQIFGVELAPPAWLDNVMLALFAILIDAAAIAGWWMLAKRNIRLRG